MNWRATTAGPSRTDRSLRARKRSARTPGRRKYPPRYSVLLWWSEGAEYATDLVFRSTATLGSLYEQLVRQSVLNVKAEQVATFRGRQITPLLAREIGSQFSTRIEAPTSGTASASARSRRSVGCPPEGSVSNHARW